MSSFSSSIPHIASTLLLLLLLIPSLKILNINGLNSLSNLVLCLFFKAPLCILVSFLKGLKLPADAFLSAFQSLAEALRSILVSIIDMVFRILGSFFMVVLGFVKNVVVFGSFADSGWGLGDLFQKTKASWQESYFLEQLRDIVGSVSQNIIHQVLGIASSSAGGVFGFVKTGISTLLNEPGSGIGQLVESLKGSWSMEGVRGIIGSFMEKVGNGVLEVGSSSTGGSFEIVKAIFGVVMDSGYTLGGFVEKTRAALELLRIEELRGIMQSIAKISVNMIIRYLLG